jgi:hypothetical protein
MGTLLGLYEIVEFSKITKESTDLHDNNGNCHELPYSSYELVILEKD